MEIDEERTAENAHPSAIETFHWSVHMVISSQSTYLQ
jgi:hypothetical protein